MKRLIFFANNMQIGGLERALLNLLNALVEKGYLITLVLEKNQGDLLPVLDSRISVQEYRLSRIGFSPLRRAVNLLHRVFWFLRYHNRFDFSCAYCTYSVIGSVLAKYAISWGLNPSQKLSLFRMRAEHPFYGNSQHLLLTAQ